MLVSLSRKSSKFIHVLIWIRKSSFSWFSRYYIFLWGLLAQQVTNLPAMLQMQIRTLDQEDPLEKEMVIHVSILA